MESVYEHLHLLAIQSSITATVDHYIEDKPV